MDQDKKNDYADTSKYHASLAAEAARAEKVREEKIARLEAIEQ